MSADFATISQLVNLVILPVLVFVAKKLWDVDVRLARVETKIKDKDHGQDSV